MTKVEDIYIDEAGNTGQDLLNEDQKAFVLASNNFSSDQLTKLASIFPHSTELHFVSLKGSQEGRAALATFINHPLMIETHIQCFTAHKEYTAVAQVVDRLIEPVFYDRGIDIYKHGQNIAITNYIYHFGTGSIWNRDIFRQFLSSFITMARKQRPKDIVEFYKNANKLYNSVPSSGRMLLEPVLESKTQIQDVLRHIDKFALDVTLSGFYVLCDLWHKRTGNRLRVYQDESKQISHYREHIEFTTNLKMEKQAIGFDSKTMTYPTQIDELKLVSSENILGVQISDLIASSIAFMYNNRNEKHTILVKAIKSSKLLTLSNNFTVWPNIAVTPKDLQMERGIGQNPLDFLAHEFLKEKSMRT